MFTFTYTYVMYAIRSIHLKLTWDRIKRSVIQFKIKYTYFNRMSEKEFCLFDVDGTLTKPRKVISEEMKNFLSKLKEKMPIGIVGGSDLPKLAEQLNFSNDVLKEFDYVFPENGLLAYKNGNLIAKQSILEYMGEEKLQNFINYCLYYLSQITLPAKRGNFIEFRTGLINVSPIGRGCSQEERDHFEAYDKEMKIREKFVNALKEKFPDIGLKYSIGGQISFDCFPIGWDKTYCLKYLLQDGYTKIHFFGDKTFPGGNDYEIFHHEATIGHAVKSPEDAKLQVEKLFF